MLGLALINEGSAMSHERVGRDRPQQVIESIYSVNETLSAAHRQAKFARMAASPRRFFDASDHLYWQDAWHDWRLALFGGWPQTRTWLHGDARVGSFAAVGYPQHPPHYTLTSLDHALIGDYQLDLWRLATSLTLDARENAGLSDKGIDRALEALARGYLEALKAHRDGQPARAGALESAKGPLKAFLRKVADKQHPGRALAKWTELDEHQNRRFVTGSQKLANLPADVASRLKRIIENDYPQTLKTPARQGDAHHFRGKDTARRLDEAGLEHYYVLLEGGHEDEHDNVILEVKEQRPPQAFHLLSRADQQVWRKLFLNEGLRHAAAAHALSSHFDAYLGWITLNERILAVRQLPGFQKRLPTHKIKGAKAYCKLAQQWGAMLADLHVQGATALNRGEAGFAEAVCERAARDEAAFIESVAAFARGYAACVAQDYRLFAEHFMAGEPLGTGSSADVARRIAS
ncbi:DUF2252 family protein [Halomonas sp. HNIBRBA4712]|uniref:DUF2252 family protein n=1 Tax=Halomonas sp. HNIBRBA4712 TaxID=3373087 RepID=UPI00374639D2